MIPHKPRKPPVKRIYKEHELPLFIAKFKFDTLQDISLFLTSNEYKELKIDFNESHVVAYRLNIESGIVVVKECIYIDQNFNLQLSYEGIPLPVPAYIRQSPFCQVRSLDQRRIQTQIRGGAPPLGSATALDMLLISPIIAGILILRIKN